MVGFRTHFAGRTNRIGWAWILVVGEREELRMTSRLTDRITG